MTCSLAKAIENNLEVRTVFDEAIAGIMTSIETAFCKIWAGTNLGVLKSSGEVLSIAEAGAGSSPKAGWVRESFLGSVVTALRLHSDGYLYAGTWNGELWRKNSESGSWTEVTTSSLGGIIYEIESVPGDRLYLAVSDGTLYQTTGAVHPTAEFVTGESEVKSIKKWDGRLWITTWNGKVFAKDESWWLAKQLTTNSINYLWRLLDINGKLVGVGNNGWRWEFDGFDWTEIQISESGLLSHSKYLDKEFIGDSNGDVYFLDKDKLFKQALSGVASATASGMGEIDGRLFVSHTSGTNQTIKRINYFIFKQVETWSYAKNDKANIVTSIKTDGGFADLKQFKAPTSVNIAGIMGGTSRDEILEETEKLEKSLSSEFKLWFDSDRFSYARKVSFVSRLGISCDLQPYSLSAVSEDPFSYGNNIKLKPISLSWSGDVVEDISITDATSGVGFGTPAFWTQGQRFVARHNTIRSVSVQASGDTGTPSGDIVGHLKDENFEEIAEVTVGSADWIPGQFVEFVFDQSGIKAGKEYAFLVSGDQPVDVSNFRKVAIRNPVAYQYGVRFSTSGDTIRDFRNVTMLFKVKHIEQSFSLVNEGNANAGLRVEFLATSGDIIDTRVTNVDNNSIRTFFKYTQNMVDGSKSIFDTPERRILSPNENAMNFFSGDFLEISPGSNTLTVESSPARYQFSYRDTWH